MSLQPRRACSPSRALCGFAMLGAMFAGSTASAASVYVAEWYTHSVAVIDTATDTVSRHIALDYAPMGIAANATESRVFVGLNGSNAVAVIDTGTNAVIATIPAGPAPVALAYNAASNRLYVAADDGITVVDAGSNSAIGKIADIGRIGPCSCLAVNRAGTRLFAIAYKNGYGYAHVIDTSRDSIIKSVPVSSNPSGVAIHPNDATVYTSDWWNTFGDPVSEIRVVDASTYAVDVLAGSWPGDGTSSSVLFGPAGSRLYAPSKDTLEVIDTADMSHTPLLIDGKHDNSDYSYGIGLSPGDNKLYVAGSAFHSVTAIDTAHTRNLHTIDVGWFPNGLVVLTGGAIFRGEFD